MLEFKPDMQKTLQRMEAFWAHDFLDRPVIQFYLEKLVEERVPLPASKHASSRDRWMDIQYQVELAYAQLLNREFMGESIPVAFPNLGPEILAAFYGCPLHFGDWGTSWTDPILQDWSLADRIVLDWDQPYFKNIDEMTEAYLEIGRGKFITGMPDWHPGGDLAAALRNPQDLAADLIQHPEQVKALLKRLQPDYFKVYDYWYDKLRNAGLPITSWLDLASESKYYIPSNDFSAMVSVSMYREFFLPGIIEECRFLDRSIYHLDGPGALRHLDTILSIPELHAVQWVPGAGNEGFARWVQVYQRIQRAGKSIIVYCTVDELELVKQTLKPQGLAVSITGVASREMGAQILKDFEKWS